MKAMTKYMLNGFVNGAAQMAGIIGIGNGLSKVISPDAEGKRHVASGIFQIACGSAVVGATLLHSKVSDEVYEDVFLEEAMHDEKEEDDEDDAHVDFAKSFYESLKKQPGCDCEHCAPEGANPSETED